MSRRKKDRLRYGDFQTPDILYERVCRLVRSLKIFPKSIVESTCGAGSFFHASADTFPECERLPGFEISPDYVKVSQTVKGASVYCEYFFKKDWTATCNRLSEPILVLGNPPWATNATMRASGGKNLPVKSDSQGLNGIDAITGKSNFDISEWMLSHLYERLSGRSATITMLCKTTVARKVLKYAWTRHSQVGESAMYLIDAPKHFGASVDACLLISILEPGSYSQECKVYRNLEADVPESTVAYRRGRLMANLASFEGCESFYGQSPAKWRSGIRHDCSRGTELFPDQKRLRNGFGRSMSLEPALLYPMLKSSELVKKVPSPSRFMLVTQTRIGEDTSRISRESPRTWSYQEEYGSYLDGRSSSVCRNRARIPMFGVGPYAFAPWKVAISGFYKDIPFRAIGPRDGKPVVFDDTCYFLPCQTEGEARVLPGVLESEMAREFFGTLVFPDAKRSVTASILGSLNLDILAAKLNLSLAEHSWKVLNENRMAYRDWKQYRKWRFHAK